MIKRDAISVAQSSGQVPINVGLELLTPFHSMSAPLNMDDMLPGSIGETKYNDVQPAEVLSSDKLVNKTQETLSQSTIQISD